MSVHARRTARVAALRQQGAHNDCAHRGRASSGDAAPKRERAPLVQRGEIRLRLRQAGRLLLRARQRRGRQHHLGCQSAPNFDPLTACNLDPLAAKVSRLRDRSCGALAEQQRERSRAASGAVLVAPAVVAGLDDVAVMGEPVEQRRGHLGIGEHRGPFGEGEVRGDDD